MNEIDNLYRCNKCGYVAEIKGDVVMCMQPFPLRTSGICGGAYIDISKKSRLNLTEITKEEREANRSSAYDYIV